MVSKEPPEIKLYMNHMVNVNDFDLSQRDSFYSRSLKREAKNSLNKKTILRVRSCLCKGLFRKISLSKFKNKRDRTQHADVRGANFPCLL
jgi:hypothetical protein